MATINDAQVIRWANERSRSIADRLAELSAAMSAYQSDYAAQGIAAKIVAAGASNLVADGSDVDGRPQISGTQIVNLKAAIDAIVNAMATNVAGVGSPTTTIVAAIQVNGTPR